MYNVVYIYFEIEEGNKYLSHPCVIVGSINEGCKKQHPSLASFETAEVVICFQTHQHWGAYIYQVDIESWFLL